LHKSGCSREELPDALTHGCTVCFKSLIFPTNFYSPLTHARVCVLLLPADGAAAGFRYFWLTDSCPQTVSAVEDRKPFEVLTLAGPIAEALQI